MCTHTHKNAGRGTIWCAPLGGKATDPITNFSLKSWHKISCAYEPRDLHAPELNPTYKYYVDMTITIISWYLDKLCPYGGFTSWIIKSEFGLRMIK